MEINLTNTEKFSKGGGLAYFWAIFGSRLIKWALPSERKLQLVLIFGKFWKSRKPA